MEVTNAETNVRGVEECRLSEGFRDKFPPWNLFHGPGDSRPVMGEGRGVIFEIGPKLADEVERAGETAELGERLSP